MNFLAFYNTLNTLHEAEAIHRANAKSAKIKYYYNIDYEVEYFWDESGYGHPWFELEGVTFRDLNNHQYKSIPGIYLIINKITKQAYVGKAVDIADRIYGHTRLRQKQDSVFLHMAVKHHGLAAFKWTVLDILPDAAINSGEERLVSQWFIDKEQYYISQLKTYSKVEHYNLTPGGESPPVYFKYTNDLIMRVQQYIDEHPFESGSKIASHFPEFSDLSRSSAAKQVTAINNGCGRFGRVKYRPDLSFPIRNMEEDDKQKSVAPGPKIQGAMLNTIKTKFVAKLTRNPWYFIKSTVDASGNYTFEKLYKSPDKNFVQGLQSLELDLTDDNDLSKVIPYLTDDRYSHYYRGLGYYLTKVKLTNKDYTWWAAQYSARNNK